MSNRYRLVKEYPGSPKLGTILTHEELQYCNWNEYYQKVIEKDYKILSLARLCTIKPTITDVSDYGDGYIEALLKYDKARIHSVKRNDGEIFTIGDKVVGYNNSIAKIKTIDLVGEISLNIGTDKSEGFSLNNIKKAKQPLFTTEDSVDIYEGDTYWWVNTNFWEARKEKITNIREHNAQETGYNVGGNFSTKEKAEEYILYNKPLLTLKDIEELLCKNTSSYFLEKFKKRAQKLNK